jgi:hypothetical protein
MTVAVKAKCKKHICSKKRGAGKRDDCRAMGKILGTYLMIDTEIKVIHKKYEIAVDILLF